MYKYTDLTVEVYDGYCISKHHFSGGGFILNSIMDIHCSTAEGGADKNRTAVDVRGGVVRILHFAEVINELPPKWKDYRNPCKNLKFLMCALYVSKLS